MSVIRIYNANEVEWSKLQLFCSMCNKILMENKAHKMVYVEECYFDFGQDWKYTALITEDFTTDSKWQSVNPRDYGNIVTSDSFSEIEMWAYNYADALIDGKISVQLTF